MPARPLVTLRDATDIGEPTMENRATRRRAAATSRSAKARPRSTPVATHGTDAGRIDTTTIATRKLAVESGAVEAEALVVTHWFDPGKDGEPYSATIRLTGQRVGVQGRPTARDTFVHEETIEDVVPGSGPVSISSWVYGLEPGEWTVSADPIVPARGAGRHGMHQGGRVDTRPLQRAAWSWRRWAVSTAPAAQVKTRWALPARLARIPAVIPGSWPLLGSLGMAGALLTQAAILTHFNVSVAPALAASMLAVLSGLVGAKVWYAVLHPGPWRQAILGGWAVDGFLFVAIPVSVVALVALDLPIGTFLDASAPGIFLAVAIGRIGCFLTGCCAGHATRSRWGLWSSDRRVGARRVPAQLIESFAGMFIGAASASLLLGHVPPIHGVIFAVAFGVYLVIRQWLLRLRAERRQYSWLRSAAVSRQGA
jgi:phosphatidylglycerol:prolipoprotein diacylglycerol transferase